MTYYGGRYGRGRSFAHSLLHLVGHLIGAAGLFLVVIFIAWLLSFALHYLDSVHKFPAAIHDAVVAVEVVLFWIDVALSGFVVGVGAVRFARETFHYGR